MSPQGQRRKSVWDNDEPVVAAMNIQGPVDRFDPAICGKVIRLGAAVCVVELLMTIALAIACVPADSTCPPAPTHSGSPAGVPGLPIPLPPTHAPCAAPDPIFYTLIGPSGLATLWICILAIFWKYIANAMLKHVQQQDIQRPQWWWPGLPLQPYQVNYTALFTAVFVGFAAFVAIPLVIMLRKCGP